MDGLNENELSPEEGREDVRGQKGGVGAAVGRFCPCDTRKYEGL